MFKKPYILKHILKTVSRQVYVASRLVTLHCLTRYTIAHPARGSRITLHGLISLKGKPLLPKQFDTDINHPRIIEDAFALLYLL
jgi:hypothetical protein